MSKPLLSIMVNQIYIRLLYQNSKNYGNNNLKDFLSPNSGYFTSL